MRNVTTGKRLTAGLAMFLILHTMVAGESMAAVVSLLQFSTITGEGAAEAISRVTRPRSDSLIGNSVDAGTGAFVAERHVLSVEGGRSLDFNLTYNSLLTRNRGPMGFGWSHNYEASIEGDPEGTVTVHWNRNFQNSFSFIQEGGPYAPLDEAVTYDELIRQSNGTWRLTRPDGTRFEFGANGELNQVSNKVGQEIELVRTEGLLTSIQEPIADKEIFLNYVGDGSGLLTSITAPQGVFFFLYDADQRLSRVLDPTAFGETWGEFFAPKTIPDADPGGLTHTIVVSEDDPIGLVEITLGNISHGNLEELTVSLTSPEGTTAILHDGLPGGPNLQFDGLILDDFEGEKPEGRWNVLIVDSQAGTSGTLNGWQMQFSEETSGYGYQYDTSGLSVDDPGPQAMFAQADLTAFRGMNGERINFEVTGSLAGAVIGTDLYADDSDLASAAVHAGLLSEGETGIITATILPGSSSYGGTTRNGVTSLSRSGGFDGSYALSRYVPVVTSSQGSRIIRGTGPDGEQLFANTHDGEGRVVTQDDGLSTNLIAEFAYTETGDGVETTYTNRLGHALVLEHDSRYRLVSATDPLGNRTSWDYNAFGDRTRRTDALGNSTVFNYDTAGNLITVVDPAGSVTTFSYDDDRNVTTIRDALGKETRFTYNNDNNLTFVTDAAGIRDEKVYGGSGQMTGMLVADGGGMNFTYQNGKLNSTGHPAESGSSDLEYDDAGRLTRLVDFDGFATEFEYNRNGQVIRETDALGNVSLSTYDRRSRLVSRTDRNGNETRFVYDGNDNLVEEIDALDQKTRFEYDGEDRRIRVIDARANTTTIGYDAAGRVVQTTDPLGQSFRFEYDAAGNQTAVFDARGIRILQTSFDERQFPVASQDALGHTTQSVYDAVGRLTETTDALGRRSVFGYDELDRPVEARDPLNRTSRQAFTGDDYTRELTNPRGASTDFSYDPANRLTRITTPEGNQTRLTYNKRDLISRIQTPEGRERNFSYDGEGRLTRIARSGPGTLDPEIHYSYDPNGNLITVSRKAFADIEPVPRLRRSYDALDRMTSYTDGNGNRLDYEYDATGNLIALVYPDGKRVSCLYDSANRLTTVTDWAERVTRYAYDADGRVTRVEFPNGTTRRLSYGPNGRIISREDQDANGDLIVGYRYSYDAAGQVAVETRSGPATPFDPADVSMSFDDDDRLSSFNGQSVSFDLDGNMTRGPLGPAFADYAYDSNNNLISAGDVRYGYDEEDRLISFTDDEGTTQLVQDPRGRLSQVVQKTDPDGARTLYVYGVGLAYEDRGGQIKVYHYDERGSTVAFTSDSGLVVGRVSYGPFGEIAQRTGETDSLFLFNGLFGVITDPQDLNYMRFRWYSSQIQRFVSPDAHFGDIATPGTLNRFAFGRNNPVTLGDPSGEFGQILVGALLGAAAGAATVLVKSAIKGEKVDWAEVGGAAIGGAITGGLIAACGACGLGATVGVGFGAGLLGGAANVASRELLFRGKKLEELDPVAVGVEIGLSAVAGALGAGAGKVTADVLSPIATQTVVGPAGPIVVATFSRTFVRAAILGAAAGFAQGAAIGLAASFAQEPAEEAVENLIDPMTPAAPQSPAGNRRVLTRALRELNEGKKGVYGEFRHWKLYIDTLNLAGRPVPHNPNNALATF